MTLKNLFGSAPDQVPLNRDLGTLAFQNDDAVNIKGTLTTTKTNKAIIDELTHDTSVASNPTVLMNFVKGNPTLDSRVSFTRATTATYIGADGYIKTAAINEPRFEYDPITKACNGLLMEEARTNLITYSGDFSQWDHAAAESTSTSQLSPDGSTSCYKINSTIGIGSSCVCRTPSISITAGSRYVATVYLKAGERKNVRLYVLDYPTASSGFGCWYDLSTGLEFAAAAPTGTGTLFSNTITSLPNGWWKISIAGTVSTTDTTARVWINVFDDAGNRIWAEGEVGTGLYAWGAQLELGNYPTSYIPTTSATVTRNLDIAYLSTDASWFNSTEGTLFCEARTNNAAKGDIMRLISLNDGTTTNRIESYISTSGANTFPTLVSGTTTASGSASFTSINTQPIKTAYAYKADNFAMIADGSSTPDTDTAGAIPVVNRLSFGYSNALSSSSLNGYVRKIAYYPSRISNNELVEITRI